MFNKKNIIVIRVDGMSCKHCASRVETAIKELYKDSSVKIDLETKNVTIKSNSEIDVEKIKNVVNDLGYEFVE